LVAKTPLRYTILPKAVRVFVPKPATEESEDA